MAADSGRSADSIFRKRSLSPANEVSDTAEGTDPKHARARGVGLEYDCSSNEAGSSQGCTWSSAESSRSDEGKIKFSRQESVDEIIKGRVCEWKAYGPHNIFDALPMKVSHLEFCDFRQKLSKEVVDLMSGNTGVRKAAQNFVDQAEAVTFSLHKEMLLDIPKRPLNTADGKVKPYGKYPNTNDPSDEEVPLILAGLTKRLREHIKRRIRSNDDENGLEDIQATHSGNHFPETRALMAADVFFEEILQFLVNQQSVTEHAHGRLFASFCAVAGLQLRPGRVREVRKARILGVDVVGVPDMRAERHLLCQIEQTSRLSLLKPHTVAVVQVTAAEGRHQMTASDCTMNTRSRTQRTAEPSPSEKAAEDSIREVLGQLTGAMISEIVCEEAAMRGLMIGFTVQCTKVQVVLMKLQQRFIDYITSEPKMALKDYPHDYGGEIWYSSPLDILSISDRPSLWKLVSIVAASTFRIQPS